MAMSRTLELDGTPAVEVQIAAPVAQERGDHWSCAYRILGLAQPVERLAMGIDAIQVLTLALCMIRADLDASAETKAGRLSWLEQKRGF